MFGALVVSCLLILVMRRVCPYLHSAHLSLLAETRSLKGILAPFLELCIVIEAVFDQVVNRKLEVEEGLDILEWL